MLTEINEILKVGGDHISSEIHKLITRVWNESSVPQEWINGILIYVYKESSKAVCCNSKGITLLPYTGKMLSRFMIDCFIENVCQHVNPEEQSGFRPERGTMDIFCVRQVQEKCLEEQMPLYQVFKDLTKVFGTVNRESLINFRWTTVSNREIFLPLHFSLYILLHYFGMLSRIAAGQSESDFGRLGVSLI
ncbi:uncharacterized protein LOC115217837 [Octopus sinensis]|uniref:Uncharacterized protein LOC115217837 n=1 Tax=Octopus sinensis TaxID=2607531 RepID=A0A6P7T048_9MOLL|nr:uncharacterized protein LOC115217837 [Octopus sinensis]